MDKIVIERNGVRHLLVKDHPLKVYCEGCSLNDICYIKQLLSLIHISEPTRP